MTSIATINATDLISVSRTTINDNFAALNAGKIETSALDTSTTLGGASASDAKIPSQLAIKTYVDTGGAPGAFTGIVSPYAGTAAPTGWLLCNGQAVSRSTYSALFAIVGTTFGSGDGSSTFNVPDLRNRLPIGAGTATKIATFVSRASNVITVSGLSSNSNNEFQTGQAVLYTAASGAMTGLTHNTTYYIVRVSNTTFSLATSLANAQAGTVIALSSDGTGTQTFTLTFTTRTLGETGGEDNHAITSTEMLAHTHPSYPASGQNGATGGTTAVNGASPAGGATGSYGGNAAMNNMQPFAVLNYIIKT